MNINDPNRTIVHMDLDSFFVSVECKENKELKGKPVIIGGSGDRGVVASCSYEARKFGVHSAMSSKMARRLCPQAIWIRGDMEKYSRYSNEITEIIAESAPVLEKASVDEFYLDVSGMDRFFGCYKWTTELKQRIMKQSGLPISFGLSVNKTISKIATGEGKPNGAKEVPSGTEKGFIAPMPVSKIPMVGEKTTQYLNSLGIVDVKTLSNMPLEVMQSLLGKNGIVLWQRANAIDHTPVEPYSERKSVSTETTFEADTIDVKMIRSIILKMVEELCFSLRKEGWLTGCITLKLRYSNFDTCTKQKSIPYTASDEVLMQHIKELFDSLYNRRMLIRLVGVRLSHLVHGNYQISLFEDSAKKINLYQAMDKIRYKFGEDKVGRAV
ncbi:DNA polymerase IV [Sporocytophaga myxococcoides]|uniref:DNA polymerase IV n=1 Tax=Sporocytophaga myxococcoides TaxID=153721 RepID=UPI00048E7E0E|nr:DNA polymerase IV [Sporocytophaga myxococcoides]